MLMMSSMWPGALAWLGPAVDDSTRARPRWYRYGPTLLVFTVLVLEAAWVLDQPYQALAIVDCVVVALLLLERRRWPLGTFGAMVALNIAALALNFALDGPRFGTQASGIAFVWLTYGAVRWTTSNRLHLVAALFGIELATLFSTAVMDYREFDGRLLFRSMLIFFFVVAGIPVLLATLRRRHCSQADEQKRIEQLETRNVLANEVHDVVGHHLSAIALRAEGARSLLAESDEAADEALTAIRGAATSALDEIRGVVRSLSSPDGDIATHGPTLDHLDELVQNGAFAPHISVEVDLDLGSVTERISRASYRIIQEAVTNARRHARNATRIEVRLALDADDLVIAVNDDGTERNAKTSPGGHGLRAMKERATQLGGELQVGPVADGGWRVLARIPMVGTMP